MTPSLPGLAGKAVIWSHAHGAWWRPNRRGYSKSLLGAGLYSAAEAREICEGGNTATDAATALKHEIEEWRRDSIGEAVLASLANERTGVAA